MQTVVTLDMVQQNNKTENIFAKLTLTIQEVYEKRVYNTIDIQHFR